MTHHTLHYAERIRAQGHRLTPQRELILDAVCEGHGHSTIEEIIARVHKKAPAINRSTVYRSLTFLQSMHLVVSAQIEGHTVYEIAHLEPHHHLVCQQCGKVVDIDNSALAALSETLLSEFGFVLDSDHLVFSGLCQSCAAVTSKPQPSISENEL